MMCVLSSDGGWWSVANDEQPRKGIVRILKFFSAFVNVCLITPARCTEFDNFPLLQ